MNIVQRAKDRVGGVIAAVFAAIVFCCCGAMMTFYLAPQQAIEANRIKNAPQMDAAYVFNANPGDDLLVSGKLVDNQPVLADQEFVAYRLERWDVTVSRDNDGETSTSGSWTQVEIQSPLLTIEVTGQVLDLLASDDAAISGRLRELIVPGEGENTAKDGTSEVRDGTLRYQGFFDGDVITVLGVKASTGGIIPDHLYAGDRVEFEQSQADAARGLLFGGILMMTCAPLVLVGGGAAALFGRSRRLNRKMW